MNWLRRLLGWPEEPDWPNPVAPQPAGLVQAARDARALAAERAVSERRLAEMQAEIDRWGERVERLEYAVDAITRGDPFDLDVLAPTGGPYGSGSGEGERRGR